FHRPTTWRACSTWRAKAAVVKFVNAVSSAPTSRHASERHHLLWASFAFSGGIIFGHYAWRPPSWWLVAWLVFAISAVYLLRHHAVRAFALALATLFILGAVTIQLNSPSDTGDPRISEFIDERDL